MLDARDLPFDVVGAIVQNIVDELTQELEMDNERMFLKVMHTSLKNGYFSHFQRSAHSAGAKFASHLESFVTSNNSIQLDQPFSVELYFVVRP